MIKGVNKYVIEVSETGNVYYDKALLFVKPEYTDIERAILEKEAKKVLIFWVKMSTIHLALREMEC